jgi:hypothetical protein
MEARTGRIAAALVSALALAIAGCGDTSQQQASSIMSQGQEMMSEAQQQASEMTSQAIEQGKAAQKGADKAIEKATK